MAYKIKITCILSFFENSVPVLQSTPAPSTFAGFAYERIKEDQFSRQKEGGAALSIKLKSCRIRVLK
jgi:hypothetical protein